MANQPDDRDPAQHEDAALVDRLLRQLRRVSPGRAAAPAAPSTAPRFDRPSVEVRPLPTRVYAPARTGQVGIWARVALGLLLGVALIQWPYERACGGSLLFYLIAVATLIAAGVWGALSSWNQRLGLAHIISLGIVLWGLALAAHEVLPRVGYARTPATWICTAAAGSQPLA